MQNKFSTVCTSLRTSGIQAVLLLLFTIMTPCPSYAAAKTETLNCMVVKVTDGDTVKCRTGNNRVHKIRLINIDAPEKSQQFGQDATKNLARMIFSRNVQVKYHSKDRYGRILGDIYYHGTSINKKMVRSGNAWAFREYLNDNEYLVLEKQVRKEKLGLWVYTNPEYPKAYRKRQKQSNVKQHKQHRSHSRPRYH